MSEKPVSTDPGYVFKRFGMLVGAGALLLDFALVLVVGLGLIQFKDWYGWALLGGLAVLPWLACLALIFDNFRQGLIDYAHNSKRINFEKAAPEKTDG